MGNFGKSWDFEERRQLDFFVFRRNQSSGCNLKKWMRIFISEKKKKMSSLLSEIRCFRDVFFVHFLWFFRWIFSVFLYVEKRGCFARTWDDVFEKNGKLKFLIKKSNFSEKWEKRRDQKKRQKSSYSLSPETQKSMFFFKKVIKKKVWFSWKSDHFFGIYKISSNFGCWKMPNSPEFAKSKIWKKRENFKKKCKKFRVFLEVFFWKNRFNAGCFVGEGVFENS